MLPSTSKVCNKLLEMQLTDGSLATECISDHGKAACKDINGVCVTETDGYYIVSAICIGFGIIFLVAFILPTARKLQSKCSVLHWLLYVSLNLSQNSQHPFGGSKWINYLFIAS